MAVFILRQRLTFRVTPCHYGGARLWVVCPFCRRRVAILYRHRGFWACRRCHHLSYRCEAEHPRRARSLIAVAGAAFGLSLRLDRIRERRRRQEELRRKRARLVLDAAQAHDDARTAQAERLRFYDRARRVVEHELLSRFEAGALSTLSLPELVKVLAMIHEQQRRDTESKALPTLVFDALPNPDRSEWWNSRSALTLALAEGVGRVEEP